MLFFANHINYFQELFNFVKTVVNILFPLWKYYFTFFLNVLNHFFCFSLQGLLMDNKIEIKKKVFLPTPLANDFLHSVIFWKYYFTHFKNIFQIILFRIYFSKHILWTLNLQFWKLQKYVSRNNIWVRKEKYRGTGRNTHKKIKTS